MTRETVYSRFTELTPEVIDRITQRRYVAVVGTDEAGSQAICNEAIPSTWVRRITRMLVKSASAAEVDLSLYSGIDGGVHLTTLVDRFKVANLSVLTLGTEDSREGLYRFNYAATLTQLYAIVDGNSCYLTTWYYDWPW